MAENTKSGYVALIGKPNAGKSTLLNAIVGAKLSIVTPKPQTTRKRVLGILTDENKQIIFLDTPGVLSPKYEMQRTMMGYVDAALSEADIIYILIDLEKYKGFEGYFPEGFLRKFQFSKKPVFAILNKIDLFRDSKEVLPIIQSLNDLGIFKEILPISAIRNENTKKLLEMTEKYLPDGPFYYDAELLSTQPERFFVAELIRETVFFMYKQEVPYSTEVAIIEFAERDNGKWYISAEIIIERDAQKKIIIGNKGDAIKKLGTKSRTLIEEHLGMPVYLELFVKVREHWRENPNMLKSFGY